MTSQQLLHEVGLLVLGATAIHMVQGTPMPEALKKISIVSLGLLTVLTMAGVAGLV